ncbi:8-oxo-dGTP pyrophosphatase MutT (NUDIX family) [Friedmanniella endophytica]|uniref:8-oxo-dGTP pyrophosphatase MutT (NUDIX family) n=1 Tax=Microlunatus kandeliicorticis TaxID=1759536 RepID=A0A7W3IPF5_9ACTN|nr:NUDIX hydrolase [Microlunatus kandeliicorticis]MBA8792817.1 8-oxo-dGTP pyrophosphatase MutT (NUDIX family) [Microlunatus kandeliicorticis]
MRGSGDGWTTCGRGHRHWGLFGAAGVLLHAFPDAGSPPGVAVDRILLQQRVCWSHHGGTWGIPGGARDDDETVVAGALREVAEETTLDPGRVQVEATYTDDHGGWTYTTVIGWADAEPAPRPRGPESDDLRWFAVAETDRLELHPGFGRTWPLLRPLDRSPRLVVDVANTMGSRPDGWWRDRAGAAARLRDQLAAVDSWPDPLLGRWLGRPGLEPLRRHCPVVLVVEGAARELEPVPGVEVVAAPGSGDDAIVEVVGQGDDRPTLVVTADRELRRRVEALGAVPFGPRSLLDVLDGG